MQNTALVVKGAKNSLTLREGEFHHLENPTFCCSIHFPILLLVTPSIRQPQGFLQPMAVLYTFLQSLCQFLLALDVD